MRKAEGSFSEMQFIKYSKKGSVYPTEAYFVMSHSAAYVYPVFTLIRQSQN